MSSKLQKESVITMEEGNLPSKTTKYHYTTALDDSTPYQPLPEYDYSKTSNTKNEKFWNMPQDLWSGEEEYIQPLDSENGPNWEKMIATWSDAQWREFGIKYFYGYIQQSSFLLDQMKH